MSVAQLRGDDSPMRAGESPELVGEVLSRALQRTQRVLLVFQAMDVRFAVADLVHQHVVDEDEHRLERPALQLRFLRKLNTSAQKLPTRWVSVLLKSKA